MSAHADCSIIQPFSQKVNPFSTNSYLSSCLKLQIPINKSRRDASPEASADTPGGVSLQCCTIDCMINTNLQIILHFQIPLYFLRAFVL